MTETIGVNLIRNKILIDTKFLTWPQKYEDFIKDIKAKFQLNQNSKIILILSTKDEDEYNIDSQDDLDDYLEGDRIKQFNVEYEENEEVIEPDPDGQNPEIIKEVFDNDSYKKELEKNTKKLSDNFKSSLELNINNIVEEKQKVIVDDIDSKLKFLVEEFSQKQNENKNLASDLKDDIEKIRDNIGEMSRAIIDLKNNIGNLSRIIRSDIKPNPNPNPENIPKPKPERNVIIDENPNKLVKFEEKNIEKIIEMKDAKFININDIKIKNAGNTSIHKLFFIKDQKESSNDFCFFGNSKVTDEYELTMPGELEPNGSLNCTISMNINYPKPGQEYKAIIKAKENDEIISEPFEIVIKINKPKEEVDPMKQMQNKANQIYEEIKNQFPNHDNLINKDDIINKLINNNLNKNEIINDINNKIKEIQQKENDSKAEQIYSELNFNNINIDKNEVLGIIKNKNFDKEEIQKWIDEKAQKQNKEKAQNLYNNLRNAQNLDFSKCPNEEAILNKIIELKFNENEIRNFFKKEEGGNDDPKVIEIFEELETEYGITSIKEKEEVLDKIKEFKCDREKINKWVEDVVSGEA